jgi:hypothetical protein
VRVTGGAVGRCGRGGGHRLGGWIGIARVGVVVILDPHVLDVGAVNVAAVVGGLDIVIDELAAEVGQVGVGDLGEVVVGEFGPGR